jgi:hypothetical protein
VFVFAAWGIFPPAIFSKEELMLLEGGKLPDYVKVGCIAELWYLPCLPIAGCIVSGGA